MTISSISYESSYKPPVGVFVAGIILVSVAVEVFEGVLVVEVPYLYNLVKQNAFDTVYHEHLSYFLVGPLKTLFSKHGLVISDISEFDIHGGSFLPTLQGGASPDTTVTVTVSVSVNESVPLSYPTRS